jgi:hypothetical protein
MFTFKQFLSETGVNVKQLAKEFVADAEEHTSKWFGSGTFDEICSEPGNCAMVSSQFVDWLSEKKIKAKTLTRLVAKNPEWARHAHVTPGSEDDAHTVVVIGDKVVDFTARQFDHSLPRVRVTSVPEFEAEWQHSG